MAISAANKNQGAIVDSDPAASSLRRRNSVASDESPTVSASPEAEDLRDQCREAKQHCGNDRDRGCAAADSTADSANSGSHEKIGIRKKEQLDLNAKFTYGASSPAHQRVKESPLSSSNIFQQVTNIGDNVNASSSTVIMAALAV